MPEKTKEMEGAALWLWCFLGAGLVSGLAVSFATTIFFGAAPLLSGLTGVMCGVGIGPICAQIRVVRNIVARVVEAIISLN